MDAMDALLGRRTVFDFIPDRPIPAEVLAQAITAGCHAPNHKLTEPWRFTIVGPETHEQLGAVVLRVKLATTEGLPPERREQMVAKAHKAGGKWRAIPAVLFVSSQRTPDDDFREREDYAATCCAIQNVQLALWAHGIGCQWGTGGIIRDAEAYRILGIDPALEEIVGVLKIGYPAEVPTVRRQKTDDAVRHLP